VKKNIEWGRPQIHVGYLGYKYTHSEYVLVIAFPLQQWFQVLASLYVYIASFVVVTRAY
jgi:hypothetical protein